MATEQSTWTVKTWCLFNKHSIWILHYKFPSHSCTDNVSNGFRDIGATYFENHMLRNSCENEWSRQKIYLWNLEEFSPTCLSCSQWQQCTVNVDQKGNWIARKLVASNNISIESMFIFVFSSWKLMPGYLNTDAACAARTTSTNFRQMDGPQTLLVALIWSWQFRNQYSKNRSIHLFIGGQQATVHM